MNIFKGKRDAMQVREREKETRALLFRVSCGKDERVEKWAQIKWRSEDESDGKKLCARI